MSRDATGYYSGRARASTRCPVCGAEPGALCDTARRHADGPQGVHEDDVVEHGVHWRRTEALLDELREASARDRGARAGRSVVVTRSWPPNPSLSEAELREEAASPEWPHTVGTFS